MICLYIGTNTGSCGLITAQKDPGKKKKKIRSCISDGMKVDSDLVRQKTKNTIKAQNCWNTKEVRKVGKKVEEVLT